MSSSNQDRGVGGLVQLIAYGAPDAYLIANTSDPHCYNHRDAMMHWFVHREDGLATKEDMVWVRTMPSILSHVPGPLKPEEGSLVPFSVMKERSAVKIQRAWRRAVSDPSYEVCQRRLLREFEQISTIS
jgi:hypothetical protein